MGSILKAVFVVVARELILVETKRAGMRLVKVRKVVSWLSWRGVALELTLEVGSSSTRYFFHSVPRDQSMGSTVNFGRNTNF